MRTTFSFSVLFFLALFSSKAQNALPIWTPADGEVKAIAATGNTLYIGGNFSALIPRFHPVFGSSGVALTTSSATINEQFPIVRPNEFSSNVVLAATTDGQGGWYIGGEFGAVGEKKREGAAHILSSGTVAEWQLPIGRVTVEYIAFTTNTVCLGGAFRLPDGKLVQLIGVDSQTGKNILWSYYIVYLIFRV